ncbi:MAG: GNAT family N-acetyltransferase [Cellulosilyticaceae bacterium]
MKYILEELDEDEIDALEEMLSVYNEKYITYKLNGQMSMGIKVDNKVVAGVDACMTAFKILYVSTLFVDETYRRHGLGRALMKEVEKRALILGANMIRLDTFNWQGKEFYEAIGYEQVGHYENEQDGFSEHFFLKRL